MKFLYNEEDLLKIKKEKKVCAWLLATFVALFVIALTVFLIVSKYQTRLLFSILASVTCSIVVIFIMFFSFKFVYLKRVVNEYQTILEGENQNIRLEILECSEFITTLPDKSRCYEVLTKKDDKETIYYLSELFDIDEIKPGKCVISVSYDYLKGIQYED